MNYREYGCADKETIILLHGGGLSWWSYREVAEKLSSDYHVILPILDGHTGSDADFASIEDNAARIIAFIDKHLGGSVLLIGGLSLGGQILLEMLAQRHDVCRHALIESALARPSRFTHAMIRPAFGSCYGLIRHKLFHCCCGERRHRARPVRLRAVQEPVQRMVRQGHQPQGEDGASCEACCRRAHGNLCTAGI